ncbi:SpoIIE family protein phosphatase [Patescibacteria group bacterium]|nr:SpoIIE family protein phosphatase [Patescibacteria group bacterium]MBU1682763.1 SpoIIE family protein phosphatase [Patescibacteria group bacterium]
MFRSVKSQIVFATSIIIILILGATAYFVIDQKIKEINHDIFTKAVSFAELTHERVVANYENNYKTQAYAHFDRELADIYSLNTDITGLAILNYNGDQLYIDPKIQEHHTALSDEDLERIQAIYPSVKVKKSGRIVYLEKTNNEIRYTNLNGRDVEAIANTDQIEDVFYPFRDQSNALRAYLIHYHVSYDALISRIQGTVVDIAMMALFGIVIALFIGGIVAGRITAPIKTLTEGASKIGTGDLKTRIDVKSKSEVGMLANTFNKMAEDLEKSTEAMIEKEKITHELELAGQIQKELLPKDVPKISNLDIAASLISADEVGGDCYDFIKIDDDKLLFYVADVTGHGVSAGLVSAINNALVPAFLEQYKRAGDILTHLNHILKAKTRPNVFMTMMMAIWSVEKADIRFAQAGHDPIIHYKAVENNIVELETGGGMALGMIEDISNITKTATEPVAINDVLVFYTDGIPEAWKNEKETYGKARFKESVKKNSTLATAQEIHDALIKDVQDFMGDYRQADDITLIVVKRTN